MTKYARLTTYLKSLSVGSIALSIEQIENIIGSKLPDSAKDFNAKVWWSNDYSSIGRQCNAWLDVGWRTENIVIGKPITFTKRKTTYLLTWNPERWEWDNIEDDVNAFNDKGELFDRWSCGNTKKIIPGDRIFLIRQAKEPRGIFASGWATSRCIQDEHWDDEKAMHGKKANYVKLQYDVLLNPFIEKILTRDELHQGNLFEVHWDTQSSGISIPEHVADSLEQKWAQINQQRREITIPEEIETNKIYKEGTVKNIQVNAYERNTEARKKCIEHYGYRCCACGVKLEEIYGDRAKEYIHIHHTVPLADIGEEYAVNPIADLKPLCPNCHAVLHRFKPPLSIEELIRIIR